MAERDVLHEHIDACLKALSHSGPPAIVGARHGRILEAEGILAPHEGNKHASKRLNVGGGPGGKTAVLGMRERGGRVKAAPVANADKPTVAMAIHDNIELGSTVYTDGARTYDHAAGLFYQHDSVNHGAGEYVRGKVHTNGMESVWAVLKRGYYGAWGANIPSAGQAALRRPVGPSRARSSEASIARLGRTKRSEDPADMTKSARTKGIAVFV